MKCNNEATGMFKLNRTKIINKLVPSPQQKNSENEKYCSSKYIHVANEPVNLTTDIHEQSLLLLRMSNITGKITAHFCCV